MNNKVRLQEYLDMWETDYIVDKRIKLNGVDYWGITIDNWGIKKDASFQCLVNKLGEDLDYVDVDVNYVLVKESDLIEKYGDPFNFDDFSVKGKSPVEIKARLRTFDFDFEGLFIGDETGSKVCFIRSNSINRDNIVRLTDILNLDYDEIGRLSDKDERFLCGKGWFYFKV